MMHKSRKCLTIIIMVVALLCGGIVSYADTQTRTLRMKFITESGAVTDAAFKLYHVMANDGGLLGDFAALPIEVGELDDSENVSRLANTLDSYAASGIGTPVATGLTNGLGYVDFTELPSGIYLVTGSSATIGNLIYTPKPALIRVVGGSEDLIEATAKYTVTTGPASTAYTVRKVWVDQEGTERPKSVTVQLLRNDEIFDEVTLSAENDWSHRWEDLSSDYDWNVIEKDIPVNYTVSIILEETTFTIENKAVKPSGSTETTKPDTTDTPSTTETTAAQNPPASGGTNPPKLPQTGQLWYPVLILFVVGAFLFFTGFIAGRLSEDNEKE